MKKSFTLIELVMVMVIVVLAGSIVAPKLVNFITEWEIKTEAEKFATALKEARQLAMINQTDARIALDYDYWPQRQSY